MIKAPKTTSISESETRTTSSAFGMRKSKPTGSAKGKTKKPGKPVDQELSKSSAGMEHAQADTLGQETAGQKAPITLGELDKRKLSIVKERNIYQKKINSLNAHVDEVKGRMAELMAKAKETKQSLNEKARAEEELKAKLKSQERKLQSQHELRIRARDLAKAHEEALSQNVKLNQELEAARQELRRLQQNKQSDGHDNHHSVKSQGKSTGNQSSDNSSKDARRVKELELEIAGLSEQYRQLVKYTNDQEATAARARTRSGDAICTDRAAEVGEGSRAPPEFLTLASGWPENERNSHPGKAANIVRPQTRAAYGRERLGPLNAPAREIRVAASKTVLDEYTKMRIYEDGRVSLSGVEGKIKRPMHKIFGQSDQHTDNGPSGRESFGRTPSETAVNFRLTPNGPTSSNSKCPQPRIHAYTHPDSADITHTHFFTHKHRAAAG